MQHSSPLLLISLCCSLLSNLAVALDCTATAFRTILPQNATVSIIGDIKAGGYFGDLNDHDFPANATNLPPLCAVGIQVQGENSSFGFGLFLPHDWNNRLIGTGNTGFGGGINWPAMGRLVHYGMVAFSTDTGHDSGPSNASWALGHDEVLFDWGYRAMHESIVMAKSVVAEYYKEKISYSYYMACSGGGRQGMKELQEYPEDFDGYAIGHPPWLLTHLHPWATYVAKVNLPNNTASHISEELLGNLTDQVTAICDPQDGVSDNIVMTPWTCNFNSSMLLCNSTTVTNCLTTEQRPTFDAIWSDWIDSSDGTVLSPPLMNGADISGLAGTDSGIPSTFGTQMVQNMIVNNSNWEVTSLTPEIVKLGDSIDPGTANADLFDLSAFRSTGGKLIHYHGLADTLIPPAYSISYFKQVEAAMSSSGNISDFYRLFLVPGLHHCSGSAGAPFFIAGGGQATKEDNYTYSVPGFVDSKHDVVLAVMDWVENGTAPDSIIATKWHGDKVSGGLSKQMPLCPYPQMAQHIAGQSLDVAEAWDCVAGPEMDVSNIPIGKIGSVKTNSTATTTTAAASTPTSSGIGFVEHMHLGHAFVMLLALLVFKVY